jgi:SAM-dependent methyltransferase
MAERLEDTLRRLKDERDEADRRYNDALTALDRSLARPRDLPQPPPAYDESAITALNEGWNILPEAPRGGGGLSGRLAGFVWRVIGPYLQRQLTFNSRVVEHLNRNVQSHRDGQRAAEATIAALRQVLHEQAEFQTRLMVLLQHITPYVDTKDRDTAGGALVLNAALSGMAENFAKRWESSAARENRYESRASALETAHADLRTLVGISQQATMTLKREVERITRGVHEVQGVHEIQAGREARAAFGSALDAYKYVGFEDQFRGSRNVIRQRLASYLPYFSGARPAGDVLDVGCGRGEFLDLLNAEGIPARGIDINPEMVEQCRARGLGVTQADASGYLESLPDGSLGGLFAAQVVEHLQPGYLLRFLELAHHKLEPGAALVLETLNPACWVAFFESYLRDITHVWPLHPDTLKFLVTASGFTSVAIEYRSPVPEQDRLQLTPLPADADQRTADFVETFNANVEKLNARIFTNLDYAIVARR